MTKDRTNRELQLEVRVLKTMNQDLNTQLRRKNKLLDAAIERIAELDYDCTKLKSQAQSAITAYDLLCARILVEDDQEEEPDIFLGLYPEEQTT